MIRRNKIFFQIALFFFSSLCVEAAGTSKGSPFQGYVQEWAFRDYFKISLHPLDIEPDNPLLTCAEFSLGFLFIPFLMLEDLHALRKAEDYPYLADAIYRGGLETREGVKARYTFLRVMLYVLLNFVSLLLPLFGNVTLVIALLSALSSGLLISLARVFIDNIWFPALVGMLPILVGARLLYLLRYRKKSIQRLEEIKIWLKERKKMVFFSAFSLWMFLYLLLSAARLQIRVEENRKRIAAALPEEEKKKEKISLEKQIAALKKAKEKLVNEGSQLADKHRQLQEEINAMKEDKEKNKLAIPPIDTGRGRSKTFDHTKSYSRMEGKRPSTPVPSGNNSFLSTDSSPKSGYPNIKKVSVSAPPMSPRKGQMARVNEEEEMEPEPDGNPKGHTTGKSVYQ